MQIPFIITIRFLYIFPMIKRLPILIILILSSIALQGQRFTSFTNNPELTVEEMKALFATASPDRKKESEAVMVRFEEFWNGPWLTGEMQDEFIQDANVMLNKKMRPYPHFNSFINAYMAFTQGKLVDYTKEWNQIILYHVNNDATTFHNKMDNYTYLFSENVIFKGSNSKWTAWGNPDKLGIDKEPYVQFKGIDLIGSSRHDSLTISGTSGSYYPSTGQWKGKDGYISWERAGLKDKVRAQLSDYNVDTRFSKVTGENATLYYPELFPAPIKGVVEDKAGLETTEEKANYPRFKSYDNYIAIPNIYKDVDYIGGFEMRGSSIMGSSDGNHLARILIKKNDKIVVSVVSTSFMFKVESVLSDEAKVNIYIEEDSIHHPAAQFRYDASNRELMVARQKNGVGRAPFIDSYHKMDIYSEAVFWKIDEERIEIKPIVSQTGESSAFFESQNYFDKGTMRGIQGYNDISPLLKLWELFRSYQYQNIPFDRVVAHFKRSAPDIRQLLIELAAQGFIEYDIHKDEIIYRSKMAQYLNNDVGKKDYDNIRLESQTHYASLDLLTNELRITGCEFFILSDAQIVNVYPTDQRVTVKKNRDMTFSGRVIGGLFDFITHNCKFDYDNFKVEMDVIDSLIMYVEDKNGPTNMYGEYKLQRVKSNIEELAGTLYIDVPGNKSGLVDYPDYPIFESRKGGKVFYDHQFTLGGTYTRDRFYYSVDVFRVVNLDNFEPDSMRFKGFLMSGGIFPDIHEPLVTRPDFSLGFVYNTGSEGLPAYSGKGHYYNMIDLSNKGLRGKGDIHYLTSITSSDNLTFYLDSLNGDAKSHEVTEQLAGTEYPHATVKDAYLHWEPYQDRMFIHTRNQPMAIFDETELTGYSRLTPSGMYGNGVVLFKRADITSRNFYFKHHELLADTANLRIFDLSSSDFAFTTDNYNSHIDFQTRKGVFISNGEASEIFFVKNEFKTNASRFDWDPIDENILRFNWDDPYKDVDINSTPARELVDMTSEGNELMATDPGKRGLRFNALNAEFDFSRNIIKANGVRFINTGDAAVIPHNGEVTIYEKADIASFTKSRILAGRENKFHELYNASVKISSGNKFKGSGDYDYIDENKTVQTIHFDTVWFQNTTRGSATIPAELDFKFSPHFAFDGRAELHSDKPYLYYVGGVEFVHGCDSVKPTRLRILQEVNPDSIYIQIHDRSRDVKDRKAVVAIASTNREGRIYTAFGAAKDQFNDAEYISVFGYITYDKQSNSFRAASMEKLQDPLLPGNMITLDAYNCITTGTGNIDMGTKLGRIDFNTNGTIINYMHADSAVMHLTTSIDFFFNDESMKIFNNTLDNSQSLEFVDISNDHAYELALIDILGETEYNRYQKELSSGAQVRRLPQKLQVKFLFSNIDFEWDKENSSFVSQRELPLIIAGGKQVYKTVPGRIVIEKRGSRNRLYIYFEFDNNTFFFQFENNVMYGYSSDKKFNEAISGTKAKNRSLSSGNGQPSFSYRLGNKNNQKRFVNKYFVPENEDL